MTTGTPKGQPGRRVVAQFRDAKATRADWMRAINLLGRLFPRLGRPSANAWWTAARKYEGDVEPESEAREALAVLVESLRCDASLNLIGRFSARDDTVRMARTHLRIVQTLRDTPAIADTLIPPPIFIVGWPRTGTTFLHTLLSCDPANRTIPYWESFDPVPPASGPDQRPAKVERMLAQLDSFAPNYQAIHPMTAHMAEECVALFMNFFRTLQFDFQYRATGYAAWLLGQDAKIAYEGYQRQLRLICHHRPHGERIVLKDPTHLVHLETLLEVFPQARLIFTHREPARAIPSICSLYAHTRAIFSDDVDPQAIGREILGGYWPTALERGLELRSMLAPGRFTDVRQGDLARDPIGTVEGVYRNLGIELRPAARDAMAERIDTQAATTRDVHEYSAAGFGIETEQLDERFRTYRQSFDLGA